MKTADLLPTRRTALGLIAVAGLASGASLRPASAAPPAVRVHRDPGCGCCEKWVEHLRSAGFPVEVVSSDDMTAVKQRLGVPDALVSCHTAEVAGYVVEGHVPADAIRRLLEEKPGATGLSAPGMPIGSPGMEGGRPEVYDVVLFRRDGGHESFGRYRGATRVGA